MRRVNKILGVVVAAGMMLITAPSTLWAESAAPTGDAAVDFLTGITCPNPDSSLTACFDPNASGTKFTGLLAVVYDKTPGGCGIKPFVNNMYVSLTLEQGNLRVPFTTDYLDGVRPHATGFCNLTNQDEQVKVIIDLIRIKVIPFFYNCIPDTGACPDFYVKSISNFQYTAGPLSSPTSGGFSTDITIAAH